MKRAVEFPGHRNVTAAMERHPAMLQEHQTDGCPPSQNGTAQNLQIHWRHKSTGAPPPDQLRQPTPELMAGPPEIPLVPPINNKVAHILEIEGVPRGYVYINTPLPSAQFFNLDAGPKDHKCAKDFNPDLLTDERPSTG